MGPIDTGEGPQGRVILNFPKPGFSKPDFSKPDFSKPDFSKRGVDIRMWRARNGFTLLSFIIALCSSAAAQPGVAPEHRPAQADSDEQRIADLVVASRILVQEGVLDSFGHVTVRSLKNPNRYFMPRAMPPALVTANDIVELDLDSVPIDANAPRTNGERFIHGEIYRVRPDVQAIVHSHAPA
jgi:Class II Aldolase and Adducin N-terminal domain